MKNIIKKFRSIKVINLLLLLILIYWNLLYFLLDLNFKYKIIFLIINIITLVSFYFFNNNFVLDWEKSTSDIKELLNNNLLTNENKKEKLLKKFKYTENDNIYKLFKTLYVKKNILNKDYDDLEKVFYRFISEDIIDEVAKTWKERIVLWTSTEKELDVMFLDIIWFTTITEKIPPERALLLLNIYFDWIVEIIKANNGYIDKFLGDWLMAIFDNQKSDNSIKAAVEIQNFISKFQVSEVGKKIAIGIWINTWKVILGTIGSKERMEITIIWDTVNSASRIEWLTRTCKSKIIISESCYKNIKEKGCFKIDEIWIKQLKWKRKKIKIFWVKDVIVRKI